MVLRSVLDENASAETFEDYPYSVGIVGSLALHRVIDLDPFPPLFEYRFATLRASPDRLFLMLQVPDTSELRNPRSAMLGDFQQPIRSLVGLNG